MITSSTATQKVPEQSTSPTFGSKYLDSEASPHCSIKRDGSGGRIVVVMGVSGTGKSTLGAALGMALGLPFIDGDDLHPAENVAKMARGEPLDDEDRRPWLETVRRTAVACVMTQVQVSEPTETDPGTVASERQAGVIVACSALKKTYRSVLRGDTPSLPTYFVFLKGDRDVLMTRMEHRQGHFMKAGMLRSQLDALESPEGDPGVVTVEVDMSTAEQVQRVLEMLSS